jgi:alpha-tubulin suppressor-like RCC1 family protein
MLPANLGAVTQITLTADGSVWAVNEARTLIRMDSAQNTAFAATPHREVSKIAAGGGSLVALTDKGVVIATSVGAAAPSGLGAVTDVMAGEGFFIAIESSGRAIMWGDAVPESPQRFRMPSGTTRLRCGPQGLLGAW